MMNTKDIVDIMLEIAQKIQSEKDYITELDSILGDGDHWANMNKGFQKIVSMEEKLRGLDISNCFKTIGMTLMSTIGGSSGVLYGDAFITISKNTMGLEQIDLAKGYEILKVALEAIMERGNAKPGDKTMIDPLAEAVLAFEKSLTQGDDKQTLSRTMSEAAKRGMELTKDMVAQKGRATYRQDKGVGYTDAGAVTMYYQLEILARHIADR
ncbi:MAG: dihydroxyacetone kinase subunit DhaL [Peptostreptococcales bacterium]|jgi:dihydroxyacetone kinase-like protein